MPDRGKPRPQLKALKQRQLLYQAVQEEVKAYIIRYDLKPGDALPPETELAQQLSVSRNSVREAIKALEALGILEARAGSGLFVRDFSFDPIVNNLAYAMLFDVKQLTDFLEVRFHIEYGMSQKVVEMLTPDQLERLRDLLGQMRKSAERGIYSDEADRAFHRHLYDNVNNLLVWKILDIFWAVLKQAQAQAQLPGPQDPMETYRAHLPIIQALEARDVEAMRTATKNHYIGIERRLRALQDAHAEEQIAP